MAWRALGACFVALLASMLPTGCGSDLPATYPVEGQVTLEGKAVPTGTITFYPENGRAAIGRIDEDGHYQLTTFEKGDGALPGQHRVTIRSVRNEQALGGVGGDSERIPEGGPPEVQWIVSRKYADRNTSPLSAEVETKRNTFDFNLP